MTRRSRKKGVRKGKGREVSITHIEEEKKHAGERRPVRHLLNNTRGRRDCGFRKVLKRGECLRRRNKKIRRRH